jgi:hypothetical protein
MKENKETQVNELKSKARKGALSFLRSSRPKRKATVRDLAVIPHLQDKIKDEGERHGLVLQVVKNR